MGDRGTRTRPSAGAQGSPFDVGLLRELAAAVDKDRGHSKSLLTRHMRDAADEIGRLRAEISDLKKRLDYPGFAL